MKGGGSHQQTRVQARHGNKSVEKPSVMATTLVHPPFLFLAGTVWETWTVPGIICCCRHFASICKVTA